MKHCHYVDKLCKEKGAIAPTGKISFITPPLIELNIPAQPN